MKDSIIYVLSDSLIYNLIHKKPNTVKGFWESLNENFLTMNNPIWYFSCALILAMVIKKNETKSDLSKILLNNRIDFLQQLLEIISGAGIIKGNNVVYHAIFENEISLHEWFNQVTNLGRKNNFFQNYDLKLHLNYLSNYHRNLSTIIREQNFNDQDLQKFASENREEISKLIIETEYIICKSLKTKNLIKLNLVVLTKKDFDKVIHKIKNQKMFNKYLEK